MMSIGTSLSVKIIPANESQAGIISHLGRTTFEETFEDLFVGYEQELEAYLKKTFQYEKIHNSLRLEQNCFLLASAGEKPVGYVKLKRDSPSPSPTLVGKAQIQLQKIYVLKDFINQRVGIALLNQAVAKAREEKVEWMWLSVVQSNTRAVRFYEKFGFTQSGTHQFTIGSQTFDFHVMQIQL